MSVLPEAICGCSVAGVKYVDHGDLEFPSVDEAVPVRVCQARAVSIRVAA